MKCIFTIVKKELLEIFRDKSTFLILLIPILIFPMLNIGLEYLTKEDKTTIEIAINCNDEYAENLFMEFIQSNNMHDINIINSTKAIELLKTGDIDCYIEIKNNCYDFMYNSTSYNSLSLSTKLGEEFQQYYNTVMSQIDDNYYKMRLLDDNKNTANATNSISSIFVPILLIMLIFQNTSSFANDIFAGEKDRRTLELLFLSNIKKSNIYIGKSISLLIISIISLAFSIGTYFISFSLSEQGLSQFKFVNNGNSIINIILLILIMVFLSIISVFLSTTISMISKNMKNAQILNEIILAFPVGLTALLSLGIIKSDVIILNYLPIVNLITCFNGAFSGNINVVNMVIAFVSNSILVGLLILVSIKYMNSEKMIE